MKLVVEFRHEEYKTYYGTKETLAKCLNKAQQSLDYRNHRFSNTTRDKVNLFPDHCRWVKAGF